ncbi:hypothetical protein [Burkholderia anthina]|uniref:hypothetical protein n=1 Tax=Burkholderia anthina TaxID=179879 RepID=UPI0015896826|nr:hypothetical protein [Burkholderia anthina]
MKPKEPIPPSLRDAPTRGAIVARQYVGRSILLIVAALTWGGLGWFAVCCATPLEDHSLALAVGWGMLGTVTAMLIIDRWTLAWEVGDKEIGELNRLLEDRDQPGQQELERYRDQVLTMGREFTRFDLSVIQEFSTKAWIHNVALGKYREYVEARDRLYGATTDNGSSVKEENPQSMS